MDSSLSHSEKKIELKDAQIKGCNPDMLDWVSVPGGDVVLEVTL